LYIPVLTIKGMPRISDFLVGMKTVQLNGCSFPSHSETLIFPNRRTKSLCLYGDVICPHNLSPTRSALDTSKKQTLPLHNKLCTEFMSFLSPALKSWQIWQINSYKCKYKNQEMCKFF